MEHSPFLAALDKEARAALEKRLLERQGGRCFIDDEPIDLLLHQGQLEIDHIIPLSEGGPDEENNFALVHGSCNRSKSASDLRVARRMAEFDKLQRKAQERGERGANLGHVLARYGGAKAQLTLRRSERGVEFALPTVGDNTIRVCPLYEDSLSGMLVEVVDEGVAEKFALAFEGLAGSPRTFHEADLLGEQPCEM
jgi:hypothetical protein